MNKVHPKVCAAGESIGVIGADNPSCVRFQPKKIMQLLRLRQINNAVFVRVGENRK